MGGGIHIDHHALHLATLQLRDLTRAPLPTQSVRIYPASELGQAEVALRSRQEPAHCLSGQQAASLRRHWRSADEGSPASAGPQP
jgi:hypothetical protein